MRDTSSAGAVAIVEVHDCEIRLPYSYPERGPDIRWLTPIFHPNISFSGFVNLRAIGLPWQPTMTLDIVCERLWDIARLAYIDLQTASNFAAKNWFSEQHELSLPLDLRPVRDQLGQSSENIIYYERRGDRSITLPVKEADVLYIGEDTPVPETPRRIPPSRDVDDEDVFYIGE